VSVPVEIASGSPVTVKVDAGADPLRWAARHRDELSALLLAHGSVLVSGLEVRTAGALAEVRAALGLCPAELNEQFAERLMLCDGVYSAPHWPADREQCLHHEQGYGIDFPRVLLIACLTPARTGGAMLVGDTRAVLDYLPAELVARFRAAGWLLERNFRPYFGLTWSAALGGSNPDEAENICAARLVGFTWEPDGTLHLTQRRSAIVRHPMTGAECWFNDVGFFSQWSVDAEERQVLLSAFGDRGLPFNARFGDDEPIGEESWRKVLDGYDAVVRRVPWRAGDLLLIDNVLCAHGREPYTGDWELAFAPAETVSLADCSPTVTPLPRQEPSRA
jgi:hypothetical protein